MKKFILPLLFASTLGLSSGVQAQTQSMFAIVGGFELLFESIFHIHSLPKPNYVINYNIKSTLKKLAKYNRNSELRLPNIESTFSFTNTDKDFEKEFKKDMGVCRGYSSLRRKFRFLAHFDLNNESRLAVPDRSNEKKFIKFYKHLVQDIRNYKFRVIPGFANLAEFSNDPLIISMMKWQVMFEWRDKNFSPGMGTNDMIKGVWSKTAYKKLVSMRDRIERNRDLGYNTLTWLTQKKSSWIHVLEAIDATPVESDGSFKITFWNDKFVQLERAKSELLVTGDGRLIYNDTIEERELNAAGVTDENDGEIAYMSQMLKDFCLSNPGSCELKK